MVRILVSGVTGAIGVPLVRKLQGEGHQVTVLVRSRPNLPEFLAELFPQKVGVLQGDVSLRNCGITKEEFLPLIGKYDVFIHAAGKTQYYEHMREETYAANVIGTRNALDLADQLEIDRFVDTSTCYVGGKKAFLHESEVGEVKNSHNPYESSKIEAERLVAAYPRRPLILRLGTVIGHVDSGEIVNAGGYAGFVKGFWALRKRIMQYPENPFWVGVNPDSTLNLITSEWVIEHILRASLSGIVGTLHLAHPNPVNMGWLFKETFHVMLKLPVTTDRLVSERTALWDNRRWRDTQESIMGIVSYFGPYVTRDTTFAHEQVRAIPGYTPPPVITESVIRKQLDYMQTQLFSKKQTAEVSEAA
jgi:nucleoside-diphosphate-sugar epimerase